MTQPEGATPAFLHLRAVGKRYGTVTALEGVDLAVSQGELVTFLGPSGSGKTTTLMLLAGFEEPSCGTIEIEGRSLAGLAPHQRNIGLVFQHYALFPHKSALDNVYFPLQMRGVDRTTGRKRAAAMLHLVGLGELGQRHPRELSGGQQQRVALARALVFEPSLLLLDEPLGALDKNLREQMQLEIRRIQRQLGVTTIFVTHDQTEAMSISDRIVVFERGRVQQVAAPLELYQRPATRFVAGFIGESNLLAARIVDARAGSARHAELGAIDFVPSAQLHDGDEVTLLIRPERIRIEPPATGRAAALTLRIDSIVHYGDSALVIGHVGGVALRLKVSGAEAAVLHEGQERRIGWTPDAVFVIPGPA